MSEHKNKSVVAAKSSGIVIGDGRHHYNFHLRVASLILVGVAVVVLLFLGASSLARHFTNSKAKLAKQPSTTHGMVLTPTQRAEYLMAQGNYTEAQKIYDSQLKAATSKKDQAAAYTAKATVSFSAKDYAAARTYETKADGLEPTTGTAEFLGDIATAEGDKTNAAGYYQSALSRLNKSDPTYGYVANKIQAKLNGVKQ